uniref:Uncharacterized protein n=1 Tax=Aegilops tauschii TaxID=37682 RepID=N1QXM7_AEGTA
MASAMTGAYVRTAELRMLEATISGVRGNGYMLGFHEVGGGEGRDQARLYPGEPARAMKYHCNFDPSHGACLRRPTGQLPVLVKNPVCANMLICSDGLFVYVGQVRNFRNTLFEQPSEALGLRSRYLKYRVQPRTEQTAITAIPAPA